MDSNEQEQIKCAIQHLVSAQVRLPMAKNIIEHNPDGAREFLAQSSSYLDKAILRLAAMFVDKVTSKPEPELKPKSENNAEEKT